MMLKHAKGGAAPSFVNTKHGKNGFLGLPRKPLCVTKHM